MNGPSLLGDISPNRYFLIGASVLGLLFRVIIPSDGSAVDYLISLLKWQFQTLVPVVLIVMVSKSLSKTRGFVNRNSVTHLFVSGLIGALLFSPLATAVDVFLLADSDGQTFLKEWLDEVTAITIPISVGWLALNLPFIAGYQLLKSDDQAAGNEQAPLLEAHFLSLVAPQVRAPVVLLQSQLHYLEVVTEKGKDLILYNLTDAIAELPDGVGFQPHRSYWASRRHIKSMRRNGRQATLTMINDVEVPVSRRLLKTVKSEIEGSPIE